MLLTRLIAKAPTRGEVAGWKAMRPIRPLLRHDHIWRFNRRAVRNGVALGLFMGTVVPLGQSFAAALVAAPLRANLAIAALCTFVSNPFTTPFFYLGAYGIGSAALGRHPVAHVGEVDWGAAASQSWAGVRDALDHPTLAAAGDWLAGAADWLLAIALPVFVGLLLIGAALAALGYCGTELGWRRWVRRRWRSRRIAVPAPA